MTWLAEADATTLHDAKTGLDAMLSAIATCRQHGQACFREEIPLCEVRAPNKVLHTKQDTTHFLVVDGDTIQTDGEILTLC